MTTNVNLSCATAQVVFPAGTVDTPYSFTLTGNLADGSAYSQTQTWNVVPLAWTLEHGTYVLVVEKNGVKSLPSAPFTIAAPAPTTVTLTVPDATQPATIALA